MNQHFERLSGLSPVIRPSAMLLIDRAKKELGMTLLVVTGWRSHDEQWALYRAGRTCTPRGAWIVQDPTKIVTRAKPGSSPHNVVTSTGEPASLALDVVPLGPDGSAQWETPQEEWDRLYKLAWDVGLDPLGDPIGSYLAGDMGHFEEPAWKLKLDGLGLIVPTHAMGASVET